MRPKGEGIAVELRFDDVDEARAFARALGANGASRRRPLGHADRSARRR